LFSLLIAALLLGQTTAQTDITAPGDTVRGVPNDGDWPGNESPPLAIDDDPGTKYLHFKGDEQSTGFQVTPSAGESIVTGLTFTTANDAPERDPTVFSLFGSNVSIDGPYTLITDGDIVDFSQATAWPRLTKNSTPIAFDNKTAYAHYQLVFRRIRDSGRANSMQIAEVEFMASPAGGLPPEVDAGDDQTITWKGVRNTIIDLYPTIYDDDPCDIGQSNPDYLTIYWSSLGQPSADFMGTENEPNAVVMFPEPGVYELQLQVWDERYQEGKDIITITVAEPVCPLGDLSGDCKVNLSDLKVFAEQWLDPPGCSDYPLGCADLVGMDGVNLVDFALIAGDWLEDWNGSLRINISPSEAVAEGARWRLNGSMWQDSDELVNNLTPGSHTVEFSTVDNWISNWIRPPSRTIQIQKNQITTITAMYTQPPDSPILINEIMALNGSKPPLDKGDILDEDGDSSDWIEIHNSTEAAISLKGWYLTIDAGDMRQWELPSVQLGPGEFKIIFASGKDRDDPDGEFPARTVTTRMASCTPTSGSREVPLYWLSSSPMAKRLRILTSIRSNSATYLTG
jgi:hypothetical protein